jgi:zinc protease
MKRTNMKPALMLLVFLVAFAAMSPSAMAKKPWEKIKIPELNEVKMPEYVRVELDNGMILYLAEDHKFPLLELSATIEVGSMFEDDEKLGLASMTGEVMRSGGTVSRPGDDIDEMVESRGMAVETYIGNDSGGAYLSVLKEDTGLGLELLADILMNPAFPQDKIDLAKSGQKGGISRRNDDPMSIARREAMKAIFGEGHVLARYPEYETIASITREDMMSFHKTWFGPNRMYLVVIGDFNSEEMVSKIETAFAGWNKAETPLPEDPEIYDLPRTVNIADKDDLSQTTIIMGHKGVRADSEHYAALLVGNRILGGGFSSRLFNEVRSRQGLAYSVGSGSGIGYRYPGMFMAYTMTGSDQSEKACGAVLDVIQSIIDEEVTEEELAQAKDGILNSEVFSFVSKRQILDRMVMYERFGYPADFLQKYQAAVKSMTTAQVHEAAKAVWHPEDMTILAVGNYNEFEGDFTKFGAVSMVDITIPEPALDIPDATDESLAMGRKMFDATAVAMGGVKNFKGLKSYTENSYLEAKIQGMDLRFDIEKIIVYPDMNHTTQKTPFGNSTVVFAGDTGWMVGPMGPKDMEKAQLVEAKKELQTDMRGLFRNMDNFKYQALEPRTLDGISCLPVYVTDQDDEYRIFFLNAETMLPYMIQEKGTSPMTQAPAVQKVYFDEYMEVEGFTVTKKMRLVFDDEEFGTGGVEEFVPNAKVDMGIYKK